MPIGLNLDQLCRDAHAVCRIGAELKVRDWLEGGVRWGQTIATWIRNGH
jgi:hypothetical protein